MLDRLNNWTSKRHRAWETMRAKGMWHYVIRRGLLLFSSLMFVLLTAFVAVHMYYDDRLTLDSLLSRLPVNAIQSVLTGLFWGLSTWAVGESQFHSHQQQYATHSDTHPSDHQS